jgi:hypothetical protein
VLKTLNRGADSLQIKRCRFLQMPEGLPLETKPLPLFKPEHNAAVRRFSDQVFDFEDQRFTLPAPPGRPGEPVQVRQCLQQRFCVFKRRIGCEG